MANFIELPGLKAFLNLEYVSLVIEQDDGSLEVNIVDHENPQLVEGDDAKNLLSCPQHGNQRAKAVDPQT